MDVRDIQHIAGIHQLSPIASDNRLNSTIEAGISRQYLVVLDSWADNCWEVIVLDAEFPEGLALKSKLQAVGAQVFVGPNAVAEESTPLIVLHASNRNKPAVQFRLQTARDLFPDALICFVTGSRTETVMTSDFNDARLALSAAGVGFVCDESGTWSTPVPARRKKFAE